MNIIFLDFDGVLNSEFFFIKRHKNMRNLRMIDTSLLDEEDNNVKLQLCDIDLDNLDILLKLVKMTSSNIVVVSSWKSLKYFNGVKKHLISIGLPIIDVTIDNIENRGEGIKNYLKNHDVSNYIVIDDDIFPDYDEEIMRHLVKTCFYDGGFKEEHFECAKLLLEKKVKNE